jgi:hypothetical protein
MADPLSLTASLIAVGTLAVQVSKFVKHALHTSDEVLALEDELEDLKALTKQLETLCQEQWPDEHQASVDEAKRILEDNIQTRLRKLQTLLAKHFRASKLKPTALSWVVLRRKINAEREGLNIGKQRLLNIFHLINTSTTRSLSFHPAQLSIDLERIRDSQDQIVKEIMNRLSQCPFPMDSNIHTILQALQQVQLGVNEINRKLLHSIDGPLKQPGPNAATEHAHGPELKHPALETPDLDSQRVYPLVNYILEGCETKCTLWCTCACHSPSKYLSLPNTLGRLAGQLLIGLSVHPWLRPRCNLQSCNVALRQEYDCATGSRLGGSFGTQSAFLLNPRTRGSPCVSHKSALVTRMFSRWSHMGDLTLSKAHFLGSPRRSTMWKTPAVTHCFTEH